MVASRVGGLHKADTSVHKYCSTNVRSEAGNSPVIGETILGAYNLRIRMWQRWPVVAVDVARPQRTKQKELALPHILTYSYYSDTDQYLVDSAALG